MSARWGWMWTRWRAPCLERHGDFPAGETVSLGNLFESNAIKVVGADVPPAYVYLPRDL
jgi:hypothetical protein